MSDFLAFLAADECDLSTDGFLFVTWGDLAFAAALVFLAYLGAN